MKKYLIFAGVTDIIFSNECTGAVRPVHFVLWKKKEMRHKEKHHMEVKWKHHTDMPMFPSRVCAGATNPESQSQI